MALEGSLKEFGLADILQLIYFQRKTGILTLEGRMDRVRLMFYEGHIISAETKRKSESNQLGRLLLKKGLIKEENLQKALEQQQATGEKLGSILIKNGAADKEQLQEILTEQITQTVINLFSWKDGNYEFSPQGVPIDKSLPVALDTQHILMEGLRIVDEWSLIEGKLTPDTIFKTTGKTVAGLSPDEEEILGLVDAESDVSTIIDSSRSHNFQTSKALVSLLEKGLIEPKETAPVAPVVTAAEITAKPERKKIAIPAIAVTFVFLLSAVFSLAWSLFYDKGGWLKLKASEELDAIRFRVEAYRYENGAYPQSLEQITRASDAWGRQYLYKAAADEFILFSAGPDGKEGTEDDVY